MTVFVLGLGARSGVSAADLEFAVVEALAVAGVRAGQVRVLATIDRRAAEENVRSLAGSRGWSVVAFPAGLLAGQPVGRPSTVAESAVGTASVAEAAALLAAGPGATLHLPKRTFPTVTVAMAVAEQWPLTGG